MLSMRLVLLRAPAEGLRSAAWRSLGCRYLSSFPPHTPITLPALSPTMTEGGLAKWKKKDGDSIKAGEVLCEVETDKATVDFEYQEDGVIAKTLVPEATSGLNVGSVIAIFVDDASLVKAFENATFADFNSETQAAAPAASSKPQVVSMGVEELKPPVNSPAPKAVSKPVSNTVPSKAPVPVPAPAAPSSPQRSGQRIIASPLARKLARELNKNLESIKGTGPFGRILAADVREAPEHSQAAGGRGDLSWVLNKLVTPHYYLNVDINFNEVIALKEKFNKGRKESTFLTVNDFIVRAAALCMKHVPEANAAWGDNGAFRVYKYCDVNYSLASPDGLSRSPLIRDVHTSGLDEIASKVRDIEAKVKENSAELDESFGTFSIVNVGEFGVKSIVPIVRPGQTTSLGVGALRQSLIPSETGTGAKLAAVGTVTLSCDHRVVDGAIGAEWLKQFKSLLENPMSMLL